MSRPSLCAVYALRINGGSQHSRMPVARNAALTSSQSGIRSQPALMVLGSDFISGCPNQEIGQTFLFKDHKRGTYSYFGADSATKKIMVLKNISLTPA